MRRPPFSARQATLSAQRWVLFISVLAAGEWHLLRVPRKGDILFSRRRRWQGLACGAGQAAVRAFRRTGMDRDGRDPAAAARRLHATFSLPLRTLPTPAFSLAGIACAWRERRLGIRRGGRRPLAAFYRLTLQRP